MKNIFKIVIISIFSLSLFLLTSKTVDAQSEQNSFGAKILIADGEYDECQSILGDPGEDGTPAFYMSKVFDIAKYAGIILLVVLTTMDFVGAVASHDEDAIQKASSKAITRLILCVVIFVLPTIIDYILGVVHDNQISMCGIGGK